MTPPIRIELLSGTSTASCHGCAAPCQPCPSSIRGGTWERIESWVERAVRTGHRFGIADLQIAAVAAENEIRVWSLDGDFAAMAKLGFIRVHDA